MSKHAIVSMAILGLLLPGMVGAEEAPNNPLPACCNFNHCTVGCNPCDKPEPTSQAVYSQVAKNLRYRHWAVDYAPAGTPSGCTSGCGGGGGCSDAELGASLPRLVLERVLYHDTALPSSLGLNWSFTCDVWLDCYQPGQVASGRPTGVPGWQILVAKPQRAPIDFFVAVDGDADGIYRDERKAYFKGLRFADAAGVQVPNPVSASWAVFNEWDGGVWTFEMYEEATGKFMGRPIRYEDRNGNAIIHTWKYAVSDPALTGSLRAKLRIRDSITDAYGQTAVFHTDESKQAGGFYVTSSIDLPNGSSIAYSYGNQVNMGRGTYGGLSGVTHPDGSQSTFVSSLDAPRNCVRYEVHDAAADPESRHKVVWFSTSAWIDPANPKNVKSQIFGRARRIENGAGELAFSATVVRVELLGGNHEDRTFYWNQGKLTAVVHHDGGSPEAIYVRDAINDGNPLFYNLDGVRGGWNQWRGWSQKYTLTPGPALLSASAWTDAVGRSTSRNIDPNTDQELSIAHPDGTTEETEYNEFVLPVRKRDRLGRITEWVYDGRGNMLQRKEAVGTSAEAIESWTYWSVSDTVAGRGRPGQLRSYRDFNGNAYDYSYSPSGYLVAAVSPADVVGGPRPQRQFVWDGAGRLTQSIDAVGRITGYGWDVRNRPVATMYADSSTEMTVWGSGADANLIVARVDRNGNRTNYSHDAAGRTVSVLRAVGRPEASLTTSVWAPGNKGILLERKEQDSVMVYAYDARLRLTEERRWPFASSSPLVTRHQYDDQDRKSQTTDPYGRRTFFVYDVNDNVTRVVRELVIGGIREGIDVRVLARDNVPNPPYSIEDASFDAEGQQVATVDGRGIRTDYERDQRGRLLRQIDAVGTADQSAIAYQYDKNGNRVETVGRRGQITIESYSGRNKRSSVTVAYGTPIAATTRYSYSLTGKIETTTDSLGRISTNVYGGCCDRLVATIDPLGFTTKFTYDFVGNRLAVIDPNGLASTSEYDARNRVVRSVNAAGEITRYAYDERIGDGAGIEVEYPAAFAGLDSCVGGSAIATIDPTGSVVVRIADAMSRVVRSVNEVGGISNVSYDRVVDGLVESVVEDEVKARRRSAVDALGRVRKTVDQLGMVSTACFDANGNRVSWRNANGDGQDCVFDGRNREVLCVDTAGAARRSGYDADGNQILEVDGLGAGTSYVYDLRGRKVSSRDRIGATTAFFYDDVGNLLRVVDAEGKTTAYVYDARNLRVSEQLPDGQATQGGRDVRQYTFDAGRRPITRRDQTGVITTYSYDLANRLVSRQYSDGTPSDSFSYDQVGRLIRAASGKYGVDVNCVYDAAGRLVREAQRIDGIEFPVLYARDATGRAIGVTYPDGTPIVREFSPRGELSGVSMGGQMVAHRTFDDGGRLVSTNFGNGVVEARSYVAGDVQVARISSALPATGSPVVTDFRYGYDANKRKLVERDEAGDLTEQRFSYDAQGRLVKWSRNGEEASVQTWDLTPVGDWNVTIRDGDRERRVHSDVHEIAAIDHHRLRYDAKGNLLDAPGLPGLSWDVENRLARAQGVGPSGPVQASYRYDALGRRVQKVVNGRATTYLSAGAQTVVEIAGRLLNAPWLNPEPEMVKDGTFDTRGSVMQATGGYRINFQPPHSGTPDGWLADEGAVYGKRGDGLFYGWSRPAWFAAERDVLDQPQWDTFIGMDFIGLYPSEWSMQVPNGTYPVIIVMGDAASRAQTNTITMNGQQITDPTPWDGKFTTAEYEEGSFDGYATDVVVTDGRLRLKPVKNQSRNPKLCFIEIGPAGSRITQAMRDRLDVAVRGMTKATSQNHGRTPRVTRYVYGAYVDEVLAVELVRRDRIDRFFVHGNHLYSPAALTNAAGITVERMTYDAYGSQVITGQRGRKLARSAVGFDRGFTGYISDQETGMMYARARMYSPAQGRFVGRDPAGYADGMGLYGAYFIPNSLDPSGKKKVPDWGRASALMLAGWTCWEVGDGWIKCVNFCKEQHLGGSEGGGADRDAKVCGPDVTQWLVDEIKRNIPKAAELRFTLLQDRWTQFALLVRPGGPWDHKPKMLAATTEDKSCPVNCPDTVTLCGTCVNHDVPSNIHYGFIGKVAGFNDKSLTAIPGLVQTDDQWPHDDPRDTSAIRVGIDFYDEMKGQGVNSGDLCRAVKGNIAKLNRDNAFDCSACPKPMK